MFSLFEKKENEIFKKIKRHSGNDLRVWNICNLLFPIFTLVVSLLFFFFSAKSPSSQDNFLQMMVKTFDYLLNGSIPLIGINLLVASSLFLYRFDKNKEKKLGISTGNIRVKLVVYSLTSYLMLSALFAIENLYSPFKSLGKQLALFSLSICVILFALRLANKLFLLQEEYIEESYAEGIQDKVDSLKNAIE